MSRWKLRSSRKPVIRDTRSYFSELMFVRVNVSSKRTVSVVDIVKIERAPMLFRVFFSLSRRK